MTRMKAFALHLAISFAVIALYLVVVVVAWNPPPYFLLDATLDVIAIVVGAALVLGPLLTLIVFKPGKRGLKLDIGIIAVVQAGFLCWGVYTTYSERPYYNVFNVDRFTLLSDRNIDKEAIWNPALSKADWQGPKMIYAHAGKDMEEKNELVLRMMNTGLDLVQMADRYDLYENNLADVLAHSIDIRSRVAADPGQVQRLDDMLARRGGREQDYAYLPIEGRKQDGVAVLRRSDGVLVDVLLIDPWAEKVNDGKGGEAHG